MKSHTKRSRAVILAIGACLISLAAGPCFAQSITAGSSVLPQFAFGGGWYSALYFSNLNSNSVSFTVAFVSDTGAPLTVPSLGGSSTQVNLAGHSTAILEAPNTGDLVEGFATFTLPSGVSGYGVFRQSVAGRADQEAVVPFSSSTAATSTLTFDETVSASAVAIVNPSSTAANISITVWDANGNTLGTSSLNLPPFNKTAAVLSSLPGLGGMAGNRGAAQFNAATGSVGVLGLRFDGAAFTSIPTAEPAASTAPLVSSFQAGQYASPSTILGGKGTVTVSGPGVLDGGATLWSLSASPGADPCTFPNNATWYVGPAANSPWAARLAKVGITSAAWSYGVAGAPNCSITGVGSGDWQANILIGISQVGDTLTIVSFTYGGSDSSTPRDQITYTLTAPAVSTPNLVTSFQTGKYVSPSTILGGKGAINVAGPAASAGGIEWSLSAATGADSCTYPNSGNWFVGPLANSPWADRLNKAGITSTAFSYGVGGAPNCSITSVSSGTWQSDILIGVSQVGNTLTVVTFTYGGSDSNAPLDEITYTVSQ